MSFGRIIQQAYCQREGRRKQRRGGVGTETLKLYLICKLSRKDGYNFGFKLMIDKLTNKQTDQQTMELKNKLKTCSQTTLRYKLTKRDKQSVKQNKRTNLPLDEYDMQIFD